MILSAMPFVSNPSSDPNPSISVHSSELDVDEVRRLFSDMGVPMGESMLNQLIQQSNISTCRRYPADKVDWEALYKALQRFFSQSSPPYNGVASSPPSIISFGGGDTPDSEGVGGLKKLFGALQKVELKKTTNVESASLFSSVICVESLDVCRGENFSSIYNIVHSTQAQTSFAVTLSEREDNPLIFVCSKRDHRDSWVEAFRLCVIKAWEKSLTPVMSDLRKKVGWQHLIIRSSYFSLVIMDDVDTLERVLQQNSQKHDQKSEVEINLLDEYNGYSALHYATILGHTECMDLLLRSGAKVTLQDRNGLSPMYHGKRIKNAATGCNLLLLFYDCRLENE